MKKNEVAGMKITRFSKEGYFDCMYEHFARPSSLVSSGFSQRTFLKISGSLWRSEVIVMKTVY